MTGVGGVFPNHEDHLLDKKKISEYFIDNFHEILYPLNFTSKHGPWQYHCPADYKNFIDLSTITWNGKIKVVTTANPLTPVISTRTEDIKCSVINNFIHSAISKITYSINDFNMGDSLGKSYCYRAYIDNLLSFSPEAKEQSLKYQGFVKDDAGEFENVAKKRDDNNNSGFKNRADLFCTANYFHFSIKLRIDLANIDQLLQPGTQLRFEIERNSDPFVLLSDVGNDTTFSFDIKDTSIEFDKLTPSESYSTHFESSVSKSPVVYSYDKSNIYTFNYSANVNDLSVHQLFHTDKLPSYLIFGMVDDSSFMGSVGKNPYNFKHFDVSEFYLLVNGKSYPSQPVKLDFNTMNYHHVYVNEFLDKLKVKNGNESIGLSSDDWINGNFFWVVDLNVDRCLNFHEHKNHPGTINFKMVTKTPLPSTTRLIVYSSSRERFTINHNGEIASTVSM